MHEIERHTAVAPSVLIDPVPGVVAKVYRGGKSRFVNLLNLSYDKGNDSFRPAPSIKIRLAPGVATAAEVFTPEGERKILKIKKERDGCVIRIPGFKIFLLLRLDV